MLKKVRATIYLLFLFYYCNNGQIIQVSTNEQKEKLSNGIQSLKGKEPAGMLALKGKAVPPLLHSPAVKEGEVGRWPNGRIQYYVDKDSYDTNILNYLNQAFAHISFNSCPEFEKLDAKPVGGGGSWLHFTNPDRVRPCVHDTGVEANGEIVVVLGYDCLQPPQILHSVLHGLGLHDEVTHPQRDLFVRVLWDNIQPAFRSMFRIQSEEDAGALLDYDPKSIMHFHDRAYSLNGQATIAPLLPGLTIEPSNELSHLDNMKIRLMFGHECKKRQIGKILESCGKYNAVNNNVDDDVNNNQSDDSGVVPGNDVAEIAPDTDQNNSNDDDDLMVVPGNDVHPEDAVENESVAADDDASNASSQEPIETRKMRYGRKRQRKSRLFRS